MLLDCKLNQRSKLKWSLPNGFLHYADEVYTWMRETENSGNFDTNYDYMVYQTEINLGMREILVSWLIEVHKRLILSPETLFIAVNTIDRYMMRRNVPRLRLQLVGVASLYIACKY